MAPGPARYCDLCFSNDSFVLFVAEKILFLDDGTALVVPRGHTSLPDWLPTRTERQSAENYNRNWTAAVILDEVERRSSIPRDMIRLVHKGKMLSEKETMKEHNIEAEATIEMSLRLLGGMEMNEQLEIHETEEDREKKRKLDEGKEGKAMTSNDDMICLKRDIMEALKRSDEKMESYSRKIDEKKESYSKNTDERMDDFSRKADEMLEKFMMVTNTVGSQIQGMKTSIVSMQEMHKK